MGSLILQLIPPALAIVLSPLAIMALVAVLLSRSFRSNGIAYLIGWAVALLAVLVLALWLFSALDVHAVRAPPVWVGIVRVVLGVFFVAAAAWVYRRGGKHAAEMGTASTPGEVVAAAPQLPGWLKAVESFTPVRSVLLGFAIFAFNPVNASCAVLAALELTVAPADALGIGIGFAVVGILPVALPVARRHGAQPDAMDSGTDHLPSHEVLVARVHEWGVHHTGRRAGARSRGTVG